MNCVHLDAAALFLRTLGVGVEADYGHDRYLVCRHCDLVMEASDICPPRPKVVPRGERMRRRHERFWRTLVDGMLNLPIENVDYTVSSGA